MRPETCAVVDDADVAVAVGGGYAWCLVVVVAPPNIHEQNKTKTTREVNLPGSTGQPG